MNFIMIGLLLREALDRLRVPLNMHLDSQAFSGVRGIPAKINFDTIIVRH